MTKLGDFSVVESGEEWLRELYKVVALRRSSMYRLIGGGSVRLLLLGNASGAALIIGFMRTSGGSEDPAYHWLALLTLLVFAIGTLTAALTTILVAAVSVKEAHGAEKGLKRFADGEIDRTEAMFTIEEHTFRLESFTTLSGMVSAATFMLGGLSSMVLLFLFF